MENREYHVQHNKYFYHQDVNIYCAKKQFPKFQFLGPQNKPRGVHGLGKHYHMCFDTKLGHGKCAIRHITFGCPPCTSMLDQPWSSDIPSQQQHCYQHVNFCTHWPVLGSFNN